MPRSMLLALPALAWMALIFYLSSQPSPPVSQVDWINFVVKKSGHVVGYAVLAAALFVAIRETRWEPIAGRLAFLGAVAYAATDEFHQAFTNRTSQASDVLIDAVGAALGVAAMIVLTRQIGALRRGD